MNWVIRAYSDLFAAMLAQGGPYRTGPKCDKHERSGEKTYVPRRAK